MPRFYGGRSFTISTEGDIELLLKKVKADASKGDVDFEGDIHQGNFSGKGVKGTYEVDGSQITIHIDEKP